MNRNTRPVYKNTGIFRIHGKEYRLDTYYPMGEQHPAYKIFHVWEKSAVREGESFTFASEAGFEQWLEDVQAPAQMRLL